MNIVIATHNQSKLKEIRQILSLEGVQFCSLTDFHTLPPLEENGSTFAENARCKALRVMQAVKLPTLADDSGLEVDALNGAPGIRSARYAGENASDSDRIELLLKNLQDIPPGRRTARFRCAMALVYPGCPPRMIEQEGVCEGHIITERRGEGGFGYDPIFFANSLGITFAEAEANIKNSVSHRGQALQKMALYLSQNPHLIRD